MTDEAAENCPICTKPLIWKTIKIYSLPRTFKLWCSNCRCFPEKVISVRSK